MVAILGNIDRRLGEAPPSAASKKADVFAMAGSISTQTSSLMQPAIEMATPPLCASPKMSSINPKEAPHKQFMDGLHAKHRREDGLE